MRARPSLSLLLSSLPSLLSCSSSPSVSPSAPSPPTPPPIAAPYVAPPAKYEPVPPSAGEPLNVRLARDRVESLVFLDAKRAFLTNQVGEFFRSSDAGQTWASVRAPSLRALSVANRSELWAASGWVADHTLPPGRVLRSTDAGQSWSMLDLKSEELEHDAVLARIPLTFVNGAGEAPLLVMGDGAFVEPGGGRAFEQWPRLGKPRFTSSAWNEPPVVGVAAERGTLYAASSREVLLVMSSDRGKSWQESYLPLESASIRTLACDNDACFVLAEKTSGTMKVFRASAGTNAWTLVTAFERRPFAQVMVASGAVPEVVEFVVCGVAPLGGKLLFAGYGTPENYLSEWPATFTLAPDGTLASSSPINAGEPRSGDDAVCKLTRALDGSLWALGRGAFRFEGGEWKRRWRYPGAERRE